MARVNSKLTLGMPQYKLGYGMRLDKGTAPELTHTHVSITLPDGSEGNVALHVISGTPDEIKPSYLAVSTPFSKFIPISERYHP
jgi:hypothetical protein